MTPTPHSEPQQNVTLNGEEQVVDTGLTVHELLLQQGLDPDQGADGVAVAVNDEVVPREDWVMRYIVKGDDIEIITASQGG